MRYPGGSVRVVTTATLTLVALACGDNPTATIGDVVCDLDPDLLISSVARDAIPALTAPTMVTPSDPGADYLVDTDRVLGVYMNGEARAYPHNILWYHEIVNDEIGGNPVSVTFCPLTGSGLAFQGEISGHGIEMGVSGLVYGSNLVLFDRLSEDVIGPQLSVDGTCGDFRGQSLRLAAVQEMSWGRWKALYPSTTVVTGEQTFGRNYTTYPYGTYNEVTSNELLWPMGVDRSRQIKERVLAIRIGRGGRGYPYGELLALGDIAVVNEVVGEIPTVVFYDSEDGQNALAFDARLNGQTLTFDALQTGAWTDRETGSTWAIDGSATTGALAGERLQPRTDAYTLFWFAWRLFQPEGQMFAAP
ncbi:MAG: DUF3179 domain-containing protein [Longimicrobiales bacterium]